MTTVVLVTTGSLPPVTSARSAGGGSSSLSTAATGTVLSATIGLNPNPVFLNATFWGTTISARAPLFDNESALVSATPARTVVWPGANAGDQYDPLDDLLWSDNNSPSAAPTNETEFVQWCRAIDCRAIFQVPGEVDDPTLAAHIVAFTEQTLGFRPVAWEIGNEPAYWVHWQEAWGNWVALTSPPTSVQYASEVRNYTLAMRAVDPGLAIIGLPGVGRTPPHDGLGQWIADVIRIDGPNLSAIAIHVYPDVSDANDTLAQFYASLSVNNPLSIPARVPALERDIATDVAACSTCRPIPLVVTELGSAISGRPDAYRFSPAFPGAIYAAAEVTQAMALNLTNVDAYATVLGTANSWINGSAVARPVYNLQSQILSRLGNEVYPVTVTKGPEGVYGISTLDPGGGGRADLLIVNTNVSYSVAFTPCLPGNVTGGPSIEWAWSNNTTPAPVSTYGPSLPTSYILAPNSLALFESQPYSIVPVQFHATGLPNGTRWFLGVDNRTVTSPSSDLTVYVPAGSHRISPGPIIRVPGEAQKARWVPNPPSNITVGSNWVNQSVPYLEQTIVHVLVAPADAGTVSPTPSWCNDGAPLVLSERPNPGWLFRGWTGGGPGNYSGTFPDPTLVPEGPVNETAIFVTGSPVQFMESGLPPGAGWTVNVGGIDYSGAGPSMSILFANGTHGYRVGAPSGWSAQPASGAFRVTGSSNTSVTILFRALAVRYPLIASESGLPLGTNWSIVLRGASYPATSAALEADLINGSYTYDVSSVAGFLSEPRRGGFVIDGAGAAVTIRFERWVTVTFRAEGLPPGTAWQVRPDGGVIGGATDALSWRTTPGVWSFAVLPPANYSASPSTGSVSIGVGPVNVTIVFAHAGAVTPTLASTVRSVEGILVLAVETAGILAVGAVVPFVLLGRRHGPSPSVVTPAPPSDPVVPPPWAEGPAALPDFRETAPPASP